MKDRYAFEHAEENDLSFVSESGVLFEIFLSALNVSASFFCVIGVLNDFVSGFVKT